MSIVSCRYTIIYVILRKNNSDENMLEVEEEDEIGVSTPTVAEEKPEEQSEEAETKEE